MKITVIIPVYNKIKYISSILEQILVQTFSDFECLLIDDGSSDGSGAVCDRFAALDSRFRVFHIPNGGVSHARNVGLDAARGEYITFIDSDDGVREGHLENLYRCIAESGADLVISGFHKVSEEGDIMRTVVPCHRGTMAFQELLPAFAREQRESGVFGYCFAKIFRRELVQNIRFNEKLKLAEDLDFYLKLYEIIETVYFDDQTNYLYLQDADNSTGNTASEKIDYLAQLQINLHYRDMLQKRTAWSGENREIVEERLSSYGFFVLFHTPIPQYRKKFEMLRSIWKKEQFPLQTRKRLGKWLFFCLRCNLCPAAKGTMRLYRMARNLRKVLK